MFVGQQLANIRQMNELSRSELAQKLNITEQAVWQYENGYTSPKLDVILRLAELFDVRSKYFYQRTELYNVINEKTIAYRSVKKNNMQKVNAERLFLEQLELLLIYIEKSVKLPTNQILFLRESALKLIADSEILDKSDKYEVIEKIAALAREKIGLEGSNNNNLLFHVEKRGAFIIEKTLDHDTDGYSTWTLYDRPFIVLNRNRKTATRRNFDIAHELGHLILHYKENFQALDKKSYNELEKEAHHFASCFLLPRENILSDLNFITKISNPKSYVDLKRKWNVSIAALGRRAYGLKVMSYQQYRHFNALLRRYDYLKNEPLDNEIVIIKPGKIRSLLKHTLDKGVITPQSFIDDFNLNLTKVVSVLNLESDFFNEYLETKKSFNFTEVKGTKTNSNM